MNKKEIIINVYIICLFVAGMVGIISGLVHDRPKITVLTILVPSYFLSYYIVQPLIIEINK